MPFGDTSGGTLVTSNTSTDNRVWGIWTNSTNVSTASDTIWSAWTSSANITISSSGTAATDARVWQIWTTANAGTTSTSSNITITTSNQIWQAWQKPSPEVMRRLPQRDREYYERLERQQEEYRRRAEEAEAARKLAEEKAERLLLSVLSSEQREQYLRSGHFDVRTGGGRVYRVTKGRHGNLKLLEPGDNGELIVAESLCVHVRPDCPNQDNMVAQKLMIECGMEEELRRIANISDYRRRRQRAA